MDYAREELETPAPSARFIKLVRYLADLATQVQTLVGAQSVTPIVARIVAEVSAGMSQGGIWERIEGDSHQGIGYGGLQQIVLDCKYLMAAAGNYLIEEAVDSLQSVIDRAVVAYCGKTNQDLHSVLQPEDWFQEGVHSAISTAIVP